jgi:hypothetical protein
LFSWNEIIVYVEFMIYGEFRVCKINVKLIKNIINQGW